MPKWKKGNNIAVRFCQSDYLFISHVSMHFNIKSFN